MKNGIILALLAFGTASCSVFPPEGEPWQDDVRSAVINLDTGGNFAYETPAIQREHPDRYTYTHSVSGEGPSFRAWWDVRLLPRDIDNRDLTDSANDHETSMLTRVRLNIDTGSVVQPWDVHLEIQDSRDIAKADAAAQDSFDIRRLYLYLGSAYTVYGVKIGRFDVPIGSGRIWGVDDDDNVAPCYDGTSVTFADAFHYRNPRFYTWRIDTWYLKPIDPDPVSSDMSHTPYDIYGAYAEHRRLWPITMSAAIVGRIWHEDQTGESGTGTSSSVDLTGRAFGDGLERGFDFDAEVSLQLGERGGDPLAAWFLYGEVGHTFPTPWKPRASFRLTWGSGDADHSDGYIHTYRADSGVAPFDEMGFTGLLGWSNCATYQAELSMAPVPGASVHAAARLAFLDSAIDPWFDRKGAIVLQDPTGAAGGNLGLETDVWLEFLTQDFWRLRAGYGRFDPSNMPEALGREDPAQVFFVEFCALF
jgi:hypothetical protein